MNNWKEKSHQQVFYQLNFLKVKEEHLSVFKTSRKLYLSKRREVSSNPINLYQSFFSFPQKKAKGVFIELIEWNSEEEAENVRAYLMELEETKRYFQTFVLEHQFNMQMEDGSYFNLKELLHKNQAIEFAVRQIKPSKRKVYPKWRKIFLDNIISKKGYEFDAEFVAMEEDLNILLFGWNSVASFERAGKEVRRSPLVLLKLMKYFSLIRSKVFQVGKMIKE
jgi:hypothetical protein